MHDSTAVWFNSLDFGTCYTEDGTQLTDWKHDVLIIEFY